MMATKSFYEKLLIATGGKPFVPKMEGQEKEGVLHLHEHLGCRTPIARKLTRAT